MGKGYHLRENSLLKTMKAAHLLAAVAWGGGALGMQALGFMRRATIEPHTVEVIEACSYFIDTWVVMPGLAGCILTGLFYSCFTAIGFIKYAWIAYKWLISVCAGFWGGLFWSKWGNIFIDELAKHDLDWTLRFMRTCILSETSWAAFLQLAIIFSMCLVSVYRPVSWKFWILQPEKRKLQNHVNNVYATEKNFKAKCPQDNEQMMQMYNDWLDRTGLAEKMLHSSKTDRSLAIRRLEENGEYVCPFKKLS